MFIRCTLSYFLFLNHLLVIDAGLLECILNYLLSHRVIFRCDPLFHLSAKALLNSELTYKKVRKSTR